MLRTMKDLEDYVIRATDGDIGQVKDVYFDDEQWVARYLIVETGSWLSSRKVLISPLAIDHPDWSEKELSVSITKEQVKNSPDIDTDKPVSRQHEMQYLGFYGYPYYWGGAGLWGNGFSPSMLLTQGNYRARNVGQNVAPDLGHEGTDGGRAKDSNPHLRSCKAVMNYTIKASDGDIGHVENFLIDEASWAIQHLVVDTSNWWFGHQVLIAPQWIQEVRWPDSTVVISMTRQMLKDAPPYDAGTPLTRDQQMGAYKHHGRTADWTQEKKLERPEFRVGKGPPGDAAGHDRSPRG